jgi:hypothetical protein
MFDSYKNLAIRDLFYDCKMSEMLFNLLLNRVNKAFGPINYIGVNRSTKKINPSLRCPETGNGWVPNIKKPHHFLGDEASCFEQAIVKQLSNM